MYKGCHTFIKQTALPDYTFIKYTYHAKHDVRDTEMSNIVGFFLFADKQIPGFRVVDRKIKCIGASKLEQF